MTPRAPRLWRRERLELLATFALGGVLGELIGGWLTGRWTWGRTAGLVAAWVAAGYLAEVARWAWRRRRAR